MDLVERMVHAAFRKIGSIKDIGGESGVTEGARQFDAIVSGRGDCSVSVGLEVLIAFGEEELTAAGGEAWVV